MSVMASDLYDDDYYAWTQAQAEAVRKRGAGGNTIDYDHVAEELEDMGRSHLDAVESLVTNIIEHLLYLEHAGREEPKAHWRKEIVAFRKGIRRKLTPTVRRRTEADLEDLHSDAVDIATAGLLAEEPEAPPPDPSRRWSLAQILGEEDDPLG